MKYVYVSEIHIYMYTLPQKKRNFPEVGYFWGGVQVSELKAKCHFCNTPGNNSLWFRVQKELCKSPANISLGQGLNILVPPPQNF